MRERHSRKPTRTQSHSLKTMVNAPVNIFTACHGVLTRAHIKSQMQRQIMTLLDRIIETLMRNRKH